MNYVETNSQTKSALIRIFKLKVASNLHNPISQNGQSVSKVLLKIGSAVAGFQQILLVYCSTYWRMVSVAVYK